MLRRRHLTAASMVALAAPAIAQGTGGWPSRPIRHVVPFPAGGGADVVGRLQAQLLSEALGVPVLVENRVGAGGTIGTAHVAQAAPDGYTLMMSSPSSHIGAPLLFRTPGYEGLDDFTHIASFSQGTSLCVVTNGLPVHDIQQLIAHARANPGVLNFGSSGAGGNNHMLAVLFMHLTGVTMTHVPYRGAAQAIADLIPGNIQVLFDVFAGMIPVVRSGAVRALAVTSPVRWPAAPEIPTVQEQGVPGYDLPSFHAISGPRGLPPAIVARIAEIVARGLEGQTLRNRLSAAGLAPYPSTTAELNQSFQAQRVRWRELVRITGLQPE